MKRILIISVLMCCLFITACNNGTSVGIIGGSDGPTSIYVSNENNATDTVKMPIRMIKVDGKLYYDSGKISDMTPRCGTLDGGLKQVGDKHEIPKNNNQCNFEGAEGYQNTTSITKEVPVNGQWIVFKLFDDPELDMDIFKYCFYLKGKMPNAERDSEIVVLTEDIDYDIQDFFDLTKSYVGPDYGKYKSTFRSYGDLDKWGITLSTENVTNKGLTLKVEQFGGSPSGELQTGKEFSLEFFDGDKWQIVKTKTDDVAWHQLAYMIKKNEITELNVNWEWLYGELPAGSYRIKKEFTDYRAAGDFDKAVYEHLFVIE